MDARSIPLRRLTAVAAIVAIAFCATGCSLFVMAGKAIFGDPEVTSSFHQVTRVDLADGKHTVAVLCDVPNAVSYEGYSSVGSDLLTGVTQRLKREGVKVVNENDVLDWIADYGFPKGREEIARAAFTEKADFVILIELDDFTHRAEKSPGMFQGKALGTVKAYKIVNRDGVRSAEQIFTSGIQIVYPLHHPISASQTRAELFQRKFIKRVAADLARRFYDHTASTEIR